MRISVSSHRFRERSSCLTLATSFCGGASPRPTPAHECNVDPAMAKEGTERLIAAIPVVAVTRTILPCLVKWEAIERIYVLLPHPPAPWRRIFWPFSINNMSLARIGSDSGEGIRVFILSRAKSWFFVKQGRKESFFVRVNKTIRIL